MCTSEAICSRFLAACRTWLVWSLMASTWRYVYMLMCLCIVYLLVLRASAAASLSFYGFILCGVVSSDIHTPGESRWRIHGIPRIQQPDDPRIGPMWSWPWSPCIRAHSSEFAQLGEAHFNFVEVVFDGMTYLSFKISKIAKIVRELSSLGSISSLNHQKGQFSPWTI